MASDIALKMPLSALETKINSTCFRPGKRSNWLVECMESTENDYAVLHGVWRSQIYGLTEIVESGLMLKDIENQKP